MSPSLSEARPQILFVDAFDSFTNNVVGVLEHETGARVTVVHITDERVSKDLPSFLANFDAAVIGPGPGHPQNAEDIGFAPKLWQLDDLSMIPVLGVCLGFQSLIVASGGNIKRLRRPRHGLVNPVEHQGQDIFHGIGNLYATQYHSLCADLLFGSSDNLPVWIPSRSCPDILPLAWDMSDEINGPVLMGARHVNKPFWGVQFHPESICTSEGGQRLIRHWWTEAQAWIRQKRGPARRKGNSNLCAGLPLSGGLQAPPLFSPEVQPRSRMATALRSIIQADNVQLRWGAHHGTKAVDAAELVEVLGYQGQEVLLLDSQGHRTARYSILGLVIPGKTFKVAYSTSDKILRYGLSGGQVSCEQLDSIDQVWPLLQECVDLHSPHNQCRPPGGATNVQSCFPSLVGMDRFIAGHVPDESPFWGGFIGYVSYEAGLETIKVHSDKQNGMPDINFAFVHRSIVIDHQSSLVYVQSLLPDDWTWILNTGRIIDEHSSRIESGVVSHNLPPTPGDSPEPPASPLDCNRTVLDQLPKSRDPILDAALAMASITRPPESEYRSKVLQCQDFLSSGDSYELCLTDRCEVRVPIMNKSDDQGAQDWGLYKRLRRNNPAPFGCFLRLSPPGGNEVAVVGSSPERFLRWTRQGRCQFRPIKGTVKKGPNMSREKAHEILNTSKERAENLMIVDLIRHDLSGIVGAQHTWVPKLMVIEEYETLYQLVSVVEGQLPERTTTSEPALAVEQQENARGLDVLKSSLPPGSMTGAPKKRSCEILQGIEQRPRGVYSGVLGYLDVGGAGDFSVVIRTLVKAEADSTPCGGHRAAEDGRAEELSSSQRYELGAGGAVTIQSTDMGEFLEMEAKAGSVLGALLT